MEPNSARIRPALLAALVALLAVSSRFVPGWCDVTSAPARMVEGIATTQTGEPLARVTLYLFALPPGETDMMTLGDQTRVVTDDQGRFTWPVPASLPPLSDYIGVRSIACYALAADRGVAQFRLAVRPNWHGTDAEGAARDLLGQETRSCETKWVLGGAKPVFSVVVPNTSVVLLDVRGPDGESLRGREVQVVPVSLPRDYQGAVVYTARTDTEGRLRLRCFPGSLRLAVFVTGLGFGSTGTFDARPGRSVAPSMPPLAPFARLSGTVPPALAGPGASVSLDNTISNENVWYVPQAPVDARGRWALRDVLPGQQRIVLVGGRGDGEPVWVTVLPSQQVTGIAIGLKRSSPDMDARPAPLNDTAPTVRGRVTDADGRPIVGADVYAVFSESGGMRAGQKVLVAKTDGEGMYLISGLPTGSGQTGLSVHLVAHQPGFGLAVGDVQIDGESTAAERDVEKSLVLPGSHAELTVRVLREGRPVPNVLVALTAQDESSVIPPFFREADRGAAAQVLRTLLAPSAQTGQDGEARFADLTPGLWDVTANRASSPEQMFVRPLSQSSTCTGIIVQAGKALSYALSLLPPSGEVALRVTGPGDMPSGAPGSVSLTTALYPYYGTLTLSPDDSGNGRGQFLTPGLFQVTARVADRSLDFNALSGPYFQGTALIAVSPATAVHSPVIITAWRFGPASIRVRLRDAHGKSLHGVVTVGDAFNSARYAASADAQGVAVFPDMPLGEYTVTARLAGRLDRATLGQPGSPLPADVVLTAGTGQPLPQTVTVRGGEETSVTIGPQLPGYVRLRLTGPLASANGYVIEARRPPEKALINFRSDPATGEYLVGPLPAGTRTLRLFRYVPAPVGANLSAGKVTVTVEASRVVRAVLTARSTAAQELLYSSPLEGMVLLPDGRTPAWGARAALFAPEQFGPLRMARADTQGRLALKDFWRGGYLRSLAIPPGTPAGPVMVAWLPGANGAVIVPYRPGRAGRMVLPESISLSGRVTVGGQSVAGLPSSFRVRAAYQGKGLLNQVLTVEATAQVDGTFTLSGLTPGTYQVQAARDNIWLSRTQAVTLGAGTPPELALDIAPPGLPVILRLEDRRGRPLSGQTVCIVRPEGPITGEVWPETLTSDSNGLLRVDGLEAGHHLLKIPSQKPAGESVGFDVPVWMPVVPPAAAQIAL